MSLPVYLDYNATTPVAPPVADAMEPYLRAHFGNPSSSHVYGQRARAAVERAREQVATAVGADVTEIVFTGGATEANNLAIRGGAHALRQRGKHLITTAVEHPSVMQPMRRLEAEGWDVTVVAVDAYGRVDPAVIARAVRPDTVLVSIMHANNEVGTVQPIAEIAAITRACGIVLHCDAAQSFGKIPVAVRTLDVDLLTLAGHKFYATKGVGALYVRRGTPITPLLVGADHEHGLRPGTENVPAIVGMGEAAWLAAANVTSEAARIRGLRDKLHALLCAEIPGIALNGHPEERLPNTLNLSFPGISGRALLAQAAEQVAASVGSACHAGGDAVSGVLGALGVSQERASGAVRLSLGTLTTSAEIEQVAQALVVAWRRCLKARAFSCSCTVDILGGVSTG